MEALGGPYVSERAWGTVREDYSPHVNAWEYLPHDHARSRAYRWNEDGLAGISDRRQLICFALALWNERDPILKERIVGLTGNEGNRGEDAKEYYFYLDSTPSHSYMKYLYKYPQVEFPYAKNSGWLLSRRRFSSFTGLAFSGSYVPLRTSGEGRRLEIELRSLFRRFERNENVAARYRTVALIGRPS